jgi:glycerol-3-phosphate dehydrogenase
MEEVTASPPPPANVQYDDRLADAKELEAALANNVKRPGARMHLQTIITKLLRNVRHYNYVRSWLSVNAKH